MRAILVGAFLLLMMPQVGEAAPDTVTICHATGNDSYVTLTIPRQAAFGQAGHFYENGTPQSGHEDDYLGPCIPTDTSTTSTTSTTSSSSSTTSTTSSTSSTTTTLPDETTTTTDPGCVGICGPGTVTTTEPPPPEACLQHRTGGPELPEGEYLEFPTLNAEGVTGTTRWGIQPCGPIPDESTTTTEPVTTSTLADGGTGTSVALSGVAGLLTLLGLGATRFARR